MMLYGKLKAKQAEADQLRSDVERLRGEMNSCPHCGDPATCFGEYETCDGTGFGFGCDTCCGHGNEDGWCRPIAELPDYLRDTAISVSTLSESVDDLRAEAERLRAGIDKLMRHALACDTRSERNGRPTAARAFRDVAVRLDALIREDGEG